MTPPSGQRPFRPPDNPRRLLWQQPCDTRPLLVTELVSLRHALRSESVDPKGNESEPIPDGNPECRLDLILQVGVGSAVSASLARQIESAVDWPDRVEGAGVAALERHLARPVVVDPVLVA